MCKMYYIDFESEKLANKVTDLVMNGEDPIDTLHKGMVYLKRKHNFVKKIYHNKSVLDMELKNDRQTLFRFYDEQKDEEEWALEVLREIYIPQGCSVTYSEEWDGIEIKLKQPAKKHKFFESIYDIFYRMLFRCNMY